MGLQMIDRDERLAACQRQRLGRGQPDHDPADQPRPGRCGDGVDIAERQMRRRQRLFDQGVQGLDMGAGRDLGHDPAIGGMLVHLAEHDIGQDLAWARRRATHDRHCGFVAAGLDPKHGEDGHALLPSCYSSPVSV